MKNIFRINRRFFFASMLSLLLVTLTAGSFLFKTIHSADAATNVILLQSDLAGLSYMPMSGIDGSYGPNTTDAVKHYQGDRLLNVDGQAGPITMGALESEVEAVQKAAGTTADGDYGPNTIAAVKAYQSAHNLGVDGIARPMTMRSMGIAREVGGGTCGQSSGGSPTPPPLSGTTRDKIVEP